MHTPPLQPVLLAIVSKHMATILSSNPQLLISAKHASDMTAAVPDLSLGMANSLDTSLPDTIIGRRSTHPRPVTVTSGMILPSQWIVRAFGSQDSRIIAARAARLSFLARWIAEGPMISSPAGSAYRFDAARADKT